MTPKTLNIAPVQRYLLNHDEMAASIGLSPSKLRELVGKGLPRVMVGVKPLYNPDRVVEWLEARDRDSIQARTSGE